MTTKLRLAKVEKQQQQLAYTATKNSYSFAGGKTFSHERQIKGEFITHHD